MPAYQLVKKNVSPGSKFYDWNLLKDGEEIWRNANVNEDQFKSVDEAELHLIFFLRDNKIEIDVDDLIKDYKML